LRRGRHEAPSPIPCRHRVQCARVHSLRDLGSNLGRRRHRWRRGVHGRGRAGRAPRGTWELVQTDSDGKPLSLADQQKTVGSGTAAAKEWKPEFSVLRYTFTTDEGAPDTHGNERFTGSYVLRKDGSDTATETQSIVYSTDSAAAQVRVKDATSANASIDAYEVERDTLTLKSSGHTARFVKSK
jgi:hypothetical protein